MAGATNQESPTSRCQFSSMLSWRSGSVWLVYLWKIALLIFSFSPFWTKRDSRTAFWNTAWSICWPEAFNCNFQEAIDPPFLFTRMIVLTLWNLPWLSNSDGSSGRKYPSTVTKGKSLPKFASEKESVTSRKSSAVLLLRQDKISPDMQFSFFKYCFP